MTIPNNTSDDATKILESSYEEVGTTLPKVKSISAQRSWRLAMRTKAAQSGCNMEHWNAKHWHEER